MGQQQLLLLVLGIVIVGLAVVVGIQAFGENQKKSNQDAITNDVIRIASDAQAWNLKPTAFGGGNGSFANVTLEKLGYTVTGIGHRRRLRQPQRGRGDDGRLERLQALGAGRGDADDHRLQLQPEEQGRRDRHGHRPDRHLDGRLEPRRRGDDLLRDGLDRQRARCWSAGRAPAGFGRRGRAFVGTVSSSLRWGSNLNPAMCSPGRWISAVAGMG